MASELEVTTIRGLSSGANANQILIPSGQTLHAPGHMVQVVEAFSTTDEAGTSTSFHNTTISATITPKFNNSIIKVECLFHFHQKSNDYGADVMLARDVGGTITNLTGSGQDFYIRQYTNDSDYFYFPVMLFATDTPATTSARTYRLRAKSTGSNGYEIFNNRGKGRMMLTEIAQ